MMLNLSKRKGMVSIEYVAFLPLFLILFGWLLTITSAAFTQFDAEMESRRSVWRQRFKPSVKMASSNVLRYTDKRGRRIDEVARKTKPKSGVLIHSDVRLSGPSFVRDFAFETRQQNYLVGGSWDYRQIKFQSNADHSKLLPDLLLDNFRIWQVSDAQFFKNVIGALSKKLIPSLSSLTDEQKKAIRAEIEKKLNKTYEDDDWNERHEEIIRKNAHELFDEEWKKSNEEMIRKNAPDLLDKYEELMNDGE